MMQDPVRNRRLFKRRQEVAARNKLREIGNIGAMGGILGSSQELIDAAQEGFSPAIEQKMTGQGKVMLGQQPMGQVPMNQPMGLSATPQAEKQQIEISVKQQENNGDPLKLQAGGILSMDPNYADYMAGQKFRNPTVPVAAPSGGTIDPNLADFIDGQAMRADITNPAGTVYDDAILRQSRLKKNGFDPATVGQERGISEISDALKGNKEANEKAATLQAALSSDDATDEEQQEAVTGAFGVENSKDGLKQILEYLEPGSKKPNKVDELLDSITGVAVGGAIGGDRSMAKRISDAMLVGLEKKLEVESNRETNRDALLLAQIEAASESSDYLDKTKSLETQHFGKVEQYLPTASKAKQGLRPLVVDGEAIITRYNALMDDSDRLLGLTAQADKLLERDDVAGIGGAAARFGEQTAAALPRSLATLFGLDKDALSAASEFDVIQRTLAAQLAPLLLGESGRTISDSDRMRVAQILGVAYENVEGVGLSITGLTGTAFINKNQLKRAIEEVNAVLLKNRRQVDGEFQDLVGKAGYETSKREDTEAVKSAIVLTEEDIEAYK